MTLKEAELFYKSYDGYGYHMFHDDSERYEEYKQLKIPKEQENIWRMQKTEEYFERILSDKENAWASVGRIIEIMHALNNVSDEMLDRFLNLLLYISKLDVRQRIIVMEDMEGRNDNKSDRCGYALFSSKDNFYEKLHNTMAQLTTMTDENKNEMAQLCESGELGWKDTYNRYLRALSRCERAEKCILAGESLEATRQEEKYNYAEIWLASEE